MSETQTFTYEDAGGIEHACSRVVTGLRRLRQTIYAAGLEEVDQAIYGENGRPIESMEGVARMIAGELIRSEARRSAATPQTRDL